MNFLYIIHKDPSKFDGHALNTMPFVEKGTKHGEDILNSTYVHYKDITFKEYNEQNGGDLIALAWDEFNDQFYKPYLNRLCKPFKECTKEDFYNGLECLPPLKWTRFNGGEFFYVGERCTADLYTVHVRIGEKYYTALRSITTPAEQLIDLAPVN